LSTDHENFGAFETVQPRDPLVGTVLDGRFQVEEIIGFGGMSVVYKATQLRVNRHVAIKTLKIQMDPKPVYRERFQREISLLCTLNHPHIVTVYDCFIGPDGQPYVVMDYLRGNSLEKLIEDKGAMPMEQCASIVAQVLSALDHAHKKGVIHRDLKPGNIVLMDDETAFVKVVDFGLAKLNHESRRLTQTGEFWGSPAYMSPEQASGKPEDGRSDIYSLGAVFYELVAGKDPFHTATSVFELIHLHVNQAPPPLTVKNPEVLVPPKIAEVIFKALEKDPANRFQTASEMLDALVSACADAKLRESGDLQLLADASKRSSGGHARSSDVEQPTAFEEPATEPVSTSMYFKRALDPMQDMRPSAQFSDTVQDVSKPTQPEDTAGDRSEPWKLLFITIAGVVGLAGLTLFSMLHHSFRRPSDTHQAAVTPVQTPTSAGSEVSKADQERRDRQGVTNKEVLIGSCISLTGTLAERGHQVIEGASSYINYVNDSGGIFGRKIVLKICDDAYDADQAKQCFNKCLKDSVFAGAFFVGSAPIENYARMADAVPTPMLGFCSGTPVWSQLHPTEFIVRATFPDEVQAYVRQLVDIQHMKRIAVIYPRDAFGTGILQAATKSLGLRKIEPVSVQSIERKSADVGDAVRKTLSTNPDAILVGTTSPGLEAIVRKCRSDHSKCLIATVSTSNDWLLRMGADADGVVSSHVVPSFDDDFPTMSLYSKLRQKYFPGSVPTESSFEGFVNALVLCEGLKRSGEDLTRQRFISALESLHDFDLGIGPMYHLSYWPDRHTGFDEHSINFIVFQGGKMVKLTDSDWRSAIGAFK